MPVTIRQVAAAAGVSPATVSHALSGQRSVSAKTIERVQKAIDELGYRPNRLAASMSTGRTMTIGAVVPDIANPYFGQMIAALEHRAGQLGYSLSVASSELDPGVEQRHLRSMIDRKYDVIIYLGGTDTPNPVISEAVQDGRIVIAVDEIFDWLPPEVARISVDNALGGGLAAQHLLGLGHRELAVISARDELPTAQARHAGFRDEARRAGLEPASVLADTYTISAGRQAGGQLFTQHPEVTAIFCANDLMALGVCQIARETGHEVPERLSVVGFDDIFVSSLVTPSLTTVHQPMERLGELAAETAAALVAGQDPAACNEVLPVGLVVRQSTGKP